MTGKKRHILAAAFAVALLLASCAGQQTNLPQPEPQPVEQATAPEPSPPEPEEVVYPQLEYEYEAAVEEQIPTIPTAAAQIYYDFFSSMEIIEYVTVHGPRQAWGHSVGGEVRLIEIVLLNQIEGFDAPVLVLLESRGVPIAELELWTNAYIIRDGELCSDISRAKFDLIFSDYAGGWSILDHDNVWREVDINGENLFYFRIGFGVNASPNMDFVLDMLREHL